MPRAVYAKSGFRIAALLADTDAASDESGALFKIES
jgi:hypothetical protein